MSQKINKNYFKKQIKKPYQSTVQFAKWLEKIKSFDPKNKIHCLDLGCGMGETIFYMAKKYKKISFCGLDKSKDLIRDGKKIAIKLKLTNVTLKSGDIFFYKPNQKPDLIISLATLSWLKNMKSALQAIANKGAEKIAFTSLMYNGPVECEIKVKEFSKTNKKLNYKNFNYNIFSIPKIKKTLKKYNYKKIWVHKFQIPIKLCPPRCGGMGTYTLTLKNGSKHQMSGPIAMPWYFLAASKLLVSKTISVLTN
jgi:SAM-dependent methyltransferase